MNRANIIQLVLGLSVFLSGFSVQAADTAPPQIVHEPCEQFQKGQVFQVVARFYDESPIFDPKVVFRRGKGKWKNRPFVREEGNDNFVAEIPARFLKKGRIQYFIEVFDENGNGPARFGSTDAPVVLMSGSEALSCQQVPDVSPVVLSSSEASQLPDAPTVGKVVASTPVSDVQKALEAPVPPALDASASDDDSIWSSPWFWTGAVAVLAGAGVGTYLAVSGDGEPVETKSTVNLNITSTINPAGIVGN